jgi:hypothetical protein
MKKQLREKKKAQKKWKKRFPFLFAPDDNKSQSNRNSKANGGGDGLGRSLRRSVDDAGKREGGGVLLTYFFSFSCSLLISILSILC